MRVSEFKAKCLAVLKEVRRTRQPLLVTLRGEPLVSVQPAEPRLRRKRLGGLKGRMTIRRDLVRRDTTRDWEVLR
jgi:prevent-host-death family protein